MSRSLSHEGASSIIRFLCGLLAGLRTYRLFSCAKYSYLPPLPNPVRPVRQVRFSFLFTAAGQFWIPPDSLFLLRGCTGYQQHS